MSEMKPCPCKWCGSLDHCLVDTPEGSQVECSTCDARGPIAATETLAIAAWNRRAEPVEPVAGKDAAMAAVLETFPPDKEGVQSRFILVHQLRASAGIQDAATKRETGWATTSDRAELMRRAADALERLAARPAPDPVGGGEWVMVPREELRTILGAFDRRTSNGADLANYIDALLAARPAGEVEPDLWAELAKHPNWSLQTQESDVEGDPLQWVVFREHGGRSDREFTVIAIADTPRVAIARAILGVTE